MHVRGGGAAEIRGQQHRAEQLGPRDQVQQRGTEEHHAERADDLDGVAELPRSLDDGCERNQLADRVEQQKGRDETARGPAALVQAWLLQAGERVSAHRGCRAP